MSLLVAVLLPVLLSGCSSTPAAGPTSPTTAVSASISEAGAAQATAESLVEAVIARDEPGFARLLSDRDPGFAPAASMIFDNLTGLPLTSLRVVITGQRRPLAESRRRTLGPGAWSAEALVSWAVVGDDRPAEQVIWLTFAPAAGGQLLAGTSDGDPRAARPLWLVEPVHAEHRGQATVIAGRQVELGPWLQRANRAARWVATQRAAAVVPLVLEVASSERLLEQVLGVPGGSYAEIAAVTWPEGTETATAALRVLVNPAATAPLSATGLGILLVHEATHVATASPRSPAPVWAVEGYADYLAYRVFPAEQRAAAGPLLRRVRVSGAPAGLPTDADFAPGRDDLSIHYAEGWYVFRYLAEEVSAKQLHAFYDELGARYGGDVDRAAQQRLGLSLDELTSGWRRYLETAARAG